MRERLFAATLALALALGPAARADAPDPDTLADISRLHREMMQKRNEGAFYPAIELGKRRLELLRSTYDDDEVQVLAAMQEQASLHQSMGAYDRAIALYERVVDITEDSERADDEALARALDMLASAHWLQQRYRDAEPVIERSLSIRKDLHGERSPEYAQALIRYGSFLWARHAYSAAERTFLRSFCILLGEHGRHSPELVAPLISLSWLYQLRGDEDRARNYVRELRRSADGEERYPGQRVALLRSSLALFRQFGFERETREVEREISKHYRQELASLTREHGENAPELSAPLSGLASLHQSAERWEEAEEAYRKLLAIAKANRGKESAQTAGFRQALASTLQSAGKPAEAAALYEKVARHYRKHQGPTTSISIDMLLADSYIQAGEYAKARALLSRVEGQAQNTFGPEHLNVARALERRGVAALAAGDEGGALADLERAFEIHEPHIELILSAGTEADNQAYFRQTAHHLDLALTLNARHAPDSPRAARFGYTTLLRRKGRILDTAADALDRAREELGDKGQELLDELSAAREKLAALTVAGPDATGEQDYRRKLMRLETRVQRLEAAVRKRSASFRKETHPVELAAVQNQIPEDSALVELILYRPHDPGAGIRSQRSGPGRYAAYVVAGAGAPELVDLGPAPPIDRAVTRMRRALADPERRDVEAHGRKLYEQVFAPIEPALGTRRDILLAPDASLNLVPFAALVGPGDRFLVRRFSFTYLTSGRDLLHLERDQRAQSSALIVADPRFEKADTGPRLADAGPRVRGARAPEFDLTSWERLPGTAAEAESIASELKEARVLQRSSATESAIKDLRRPSILHIATHGFFMPESRSPPAETGPDKDVDPLAPPDPGGGDAAAGETAGMELSGPQVASGGDQPLLRSGLVFAGVNRLESGRDDGVLTALEAAGLDLRGTRLVVLSACETGVGETTRGDGVHGLRRAFVLAGAQSLVMSMWQVDDEATRALMSGFYGYLDEGLGRSEALRRVQLETLRTERYRHPYYWASFVPAGDWTPLHDSPR